MKMLVLTLSISFPPTSAAASKPFVIPIPVLAATVSSSGFGRLPFVTYAVE